MLFTPKRIQAVKRNHHFTRDLRCGTRFGVVYDLAFFWYSEATSILNIDNDLWSLVTMVSFSKRNN